MMLFYVLVAVLGKACAHSVCYGKYGCFSDDAPFNRVSVKLPESPLAVGTKYTLFTQMNTDGHILSDGDEETFYSSSFKGTRNTKFVVHGYFEGGGEEQWQRELKNALLEREDVNLIMVDWGKGASFPYYQATGNTRVVGAMIAEMILFLSNLAKNTAMDYHVIGFSLGGQIAGYAGNHLKEKGHTLGRITGLDPAGPYFELEHSLVKLDSSDAVFVDVIHSSVNTFWLFGLGTSESSGHVDFYPNGGYHQPGCHDLIQTIKDLFDKLWQVPIEYVSCSHFRAVRYYIESINSPWKMRGFRCNSKEEFDDGKCFSCEEGTCPIFGYDVIEAKNTARGNYYLSTQRTQPFFTFPYKITFFTGNGPFSADDSSVFVLLKGTKGKTPYIELDKKSHDKDSVVSHVAASRLDIGEPLSITVKKGGINLVNPWHINKVTIQTVLSRDTEIYTACFKKWLYPLFSVKKEFKQGADIQC